MKKEFIWWIALAILSTLIIGVVTRFRFSSVDIQLHDTYYVFDSIDAIKVLTFIFILGRYAYLLTDIIADRYLLLALIMSIINAIAGLFVFILAYLCVETTVHSMKMSPDTDFSGHFLLTGILAGLLAMQIIVEIKLIRKLRGVLKQK